MTPQLSDLAKAFSPSSEEWKKIRHPYKAIPKVVREKLQTPFLAKAYEAQDISQQIHPNRLGIFLRPYLSGDPLKSLSLRHFVLQDSLMSRVDFLPGRGVVTFFVHLYENMLFSSTSVNKGQIALAVAGMCESFHRSLTQHVKIEFIFDKSPLETLIKSDYLGKSHRVYLLSDFLWSADPVKDLFSETKSALMRHLKKKTQVHAFMIRDPLELAQGFSEQDSQLLLPFMQNQSSPTEHFSGADYLQNASQNEQEWMGAFEQQFWNAQSIHSHSEIYPILDTIARMKRSAR